MLGYKFLKPTADPTVFQSPFKAADWRVNQLPPMAAHLEVGFSGYHFQPSIPELINAPWYAGVATVLQEYCANQLVIGEFDVVGCHKSNGSNNCATHLKLLRICNRLGAKKEAALTQLLSNKLDVGQAHELPEIQKILAIRPRCPFRPGDRVYFRPNSNCVGTVLHTFFCPYETTGRKFWVAVQLDVRVDAMINGVQAFQSSTGSVLFSDNKLVKIKAGKE